MLEMDFMENNTNAISICAAGSNSSLLIQNLVVSLEFNAGGTGKCWKVESFINVD